MNIYEVRCLSWRCRVKAGSFRVAINRGLESLTKEISPDKQKTITVIASVMLKNVPANHPVPDFEDEKPAGSDTK